MRETSEESKRSTIGQKIGSGEWRERVPVGCEDNPEKTDQHMERSCLFKSVVTRHEYAVVEGVQTLPPTRA